MNDLITKVMASFFEGLEDMDAVAFMPKEAELMWWIHAESPEILNSEFEGKIMISRLGIYVANGIEFWTDDNYPGAQRIYLPEGIFYVAEGCNILQYHLDKYFSQSREG